MNTNSTPAGSRFRAALQQGGVVMPGVFDAITARLASVQGFKALYLSGAGVTNSLTGMPDIALITLTEMAAQARYVCRATDLPVIADADTGYGDVLNVARAVEEFEHAGLAGLHIEDQVSPKRCGHLNGKRVVEPAVMAQKIAAAVASRREPSFFIIARTDARSINGVDDAISRAKYYMDAGADGIFPESLEGRDEFEKFAKEVKAPLLANMTEFGKTPLIAADEFFGMGYSMVIFPMTAFRVMMRAAEQTYSVLKEQSSQRTLIDKMQSRVELYELLGYSGFTDFDHSIAEQTKEQD